MASGSDKVRVIIAAIFVLIGWAVALAGVAKINSDCNTLYNMFFGTGSISKACSDEVRWQWWSVWFCFFLTVVLLVMVVLGKAAAWTSTLQVLCAVCLGVSMFAAHWTYEGAFYDGRTAAFVGFVVSSTALFFVIIFLGAGAAGVNVSAGMAANEMSPDRNKTSPDLNKASPDQKADEVEEVPQQPAGVDSA